MVDDFSRYPICDTTMIIDLGLVKLFDQFISSKKKIFIASKVKDELVSKLSDSLDYKFLIDSLDNRDDIEFIDNSYFSEEQLLVMEANLSDYGIQNCLFSNNIGKDFGEFISAIYAVNLGIKKLKTNDRKFIDAYNEEMIFKDLLMIDLNETLRGFLKDNHRIRTMKEIGCKNEKMNKILDKEKLLKMVDKLMLKFNN